MQKYHSQCYGLSDVGRVRQNNEDQFLIADLSSSMVVHRSTVAMLNERHLFGDAEGHLLLVADGVGGQASGERASQLTTETIANHILQTMPWLLRLRHDADAYVDSHLHEELLAAVMRCERAVEEEAAAHESERDMGTTLTLAYGIWPQLFVVHVGDSRCYLLRNGQLRQITRDHTVLRVLEDGGAIMNENARRQYGSVLINAIGRGADKLVPEVYKVQLEPNDTIMLCSDGLTDMLSDEKIQEILSQNRGDEVESCHALVAAANEAGGRDNVTVVVSRYVRATHASVSATQSRSDTAEMSVVTD